MRRPVYIGKIKDIIMKQNTITALRKVIKEMVTKEVAKQIKSVVDEIKKPTVAETDSVDYYTGPEPAKQQLAKDPTLNKILNETKGGISQGDTGMEPYPTMGGGVTDTQEKFFQQTGTAPVGISGNQPDFMKKALSGHYKEVIDKVEETRGTRTK
jgi:hypothetical protein